MKFTLNIKRYLNKVKKHPKLVGVVSMTATLLLLGGVIVKNVYVAGEQKQKNEAAKVLSLSNEVEPEASEQPTSPTQAPSETNYDINNTTTPIKTPTPTSSPPSDTGGSEETPVQTSEQGSEEFNVSLTVIGLVDGDTNCRETKVTSNKTITDYTYISGSDFSGGGSPQSNSFIFGICKKTGVYDYYLTLYASTGEKKVIHEFFSSWPPANSFPTPTPTEIPAHDPLQASWDVQTIHTGELKELACDSKGCFKSDAYQQAIITANIQLKSCQFRTGGYSSPNGAISVNTNNAEGVVENNICTYTTGVGYTITGAIIESIYGETMTFGDW